MTATIFDLTVGSLLIGTFVTTFLFGIVFLQFYIFCRSSSNDPLWLRVMVTWVCLLEAAHTLTSWTEVYRLTVTFYGQPLAIERNNVSISLLFAFSGLIGSTVQAYYGYRILIVSKSWIIPTIIWFGGIIRIAFAGTLAIFPFHSPTISYFTSHYVSLLLVPLAIQVFMDLLNAGALSYYLRQGRVATFKSRKIIDMLILYTIETGLVTSLFAIITFGVTFRQRNNYIQLGFYTIYPKLFSISLLTSLNIREDLRKIETTGTSLLFESAINRDYHPDSEATSSTVLSAVKDRSMPYPVNPGSQSIELKSRLSTATPRLEC
ncbi:hypothetical protein M422DRAFT_29553 [Sphaerobolus stellatus SS14]|uniref:DUF6534 domain-containing protein n=1 Tax=Sphaerobolus stellatus (strain SS14) TaxID=990650 RepID=A0A0C9W3X9_SPHS4|nr:hypothetical protein M422DRAFT_29553 [Sphaerobolus stellatus SS14]